ncbi:MAG: tetratricopeptide repeat protein [Desulfovibrionaceae bacterium]|nr:tetratricopeptide repeat protein [Desulfovibrionaceae bacterium]
MFQDPAHLGPYFSKHVAVLVRDHLKSSAKDTQRPKPNVSSPQVFRGVSLAAEFPGLPKVRRGTSFISHESLCLEGGNVASVPLGRVEIDSIFFRASRQNGYLSFESNGVALSKVVAYQEQRGFFCRSIRPVFKVEGEVGLSARRIPGAPLCENDIHQVEPPEDAPGTFDLVGLLVRHPVSDDIEYERGASLDRHWVKRYRESLRSVKLALNNQLEKVDAPESLYIASTLAADSSLAIAAIEKALKLAGDNTHYHAQYGARLSEAKMLKKAVSAMADAVSLAPDVSGHHMFLSHIYGGLGNFQAALSAVEAAVAVKEDHSGFHHRRGNLLFQMGNLDEAEKALNRSLELDPEAADAHFQLSRIYEKRGDLEGALSEIRTALAIRDEPVYRTHLAKLSNFG